jgi:hypothetical protein
MAHAYASVKLVHHCTHAYTSVIKLKHHSTNQRHHSSKATMNNPAKQQHNNPAKQQ